MLQRGDPVPHFKVRTVRGDRFSYSTIWQRRNLVLLALPASESALPQDYIAQLMARKSEFTAQNSECVITRDPVPGIPDLGVVVADRWGEIAHVSTPPRVDDLPAAEELLEWVDYLERRCPECEGEAK